MKKILNPYAIACLICSILIAVTENVYPQSENYYDVLWKLEGPSGQSGLILSINNINDRFTTIFDQAKITEDALINALEGGGLSMDEFRKWLRKSIKDPDMRRDLQDIVEDCRNLAKDMNDVISSFDKIIKEYPDAYFKKIEACLLVNNTEEALRTYEEWKRARAPITQEVDTTTIRDIFYDIAIAYLHQGIISSSQIPTEGAKISQESSQTPDAEVIRSYIELKRKILLSELQDDKIDETKEENLQNELIWVNFELSEFYAESGRQKKARDEYEHLYTDTLKAKLRAAAYATVDSNLYNFYNNQLQNLKNCFVYIEVDPKLNGSRIRLAHYPEPVEGRKKSLGLWLGGKQIAAIHLPLLNAEQSRLPLSSIRVQLVNEITIDEEHHVYSLIVPRKSIEESFLFHVDDLKNLSSLVTKLRDARDSPSQYLRKQFSRDTQLLIEEYEDSISQSGELKGVLITELNQLLKEEQLFEQVIPTNETLRLIKQNLQGMNPIHRNRLLLEEAYPDEIAKLKPYYCTIKLPAIEVWQSNKIPLEIKWGREGRKEQSDLLEDNATLKLPEREKPMQIKSGSVEKLPEGIYPDIKINMALMLEKEYQDEYQLSVKLKQPDHHPIITRIILASMLASSIILRLL